MRTHGLKNRVFFCYAVIFLSHVFVVGCKKFKRMTSYKPLRYIFSSEQCLLSVYYHVPADHVPEDPSQPDLELDVSPLFSLL
jgi:hypothetical protein